MRWSDIAIAVVITLAVVLAIAIFARLLNRLFAVLGSVVDEWRPTPVGQARPGHDRLGLGIILVAMPIVALLWYNLGPALVTLASGSLAHLDLQAIFALLLVMVFAPAAGTLALLSWKNARLEFSGDKIRQTTIFGGQRDWEKVTAASMQRNLRAPSAVYFALTHGLIRAYTAWTSIRGAYESLGRAGVPIEPWREQVAK